MSPTVENVGSDGHPRLTREPRTLERFNPIACFPPVLFQLLTTIDGADGANTMVATFTDDTYDRECGPGETSRSSRYVT